MSWPWSRETSRILPTDIVLACPRCQGRQCEGIGALAVDVNRDGKIVSVLTGHKWECCRCKTAFCSSLDGSYVPRQFEHVRPVPPRDSSSPSRETYEDAIRNHEGAPPRIPSRPQKPMPLAPPRVP